MMTRMRDFTVSKFSVLLYFFLFVNISCRRVIKNYAFNGTFEDEQLTELWNSSHTSTTNRRLSADTRKSHRIVSLPGLPKDIPFDHYAGHIQVDAQKNSNIFYWLFESNKNPEEKPLLIWLNGGPGCSSMDGLWIELGPLRLSSDKKSIKINPFSWHNAANLLFIDQPVGTGLSYTKSPSGYAKNDDMVNQHFYTFLLQFYALHPQYISTIKDGRKQARTLFFSGESHAGHYIPSMAAYILTKNKEITNPTEQLYIPVEGIALGNPWIDPPTQYNPAEFAHGLGFISNGQLNAMKEVEKKCHIQLKQGKLHNSFCFSMLDTVVDATSINGAHKVLFYDVRKYVASSAIFPPGHEALESYLNRPDVKAAIHATSSPKYEECADPPYFALIHQDGKGVMNEIAMLLDQKVRVLIFAGQYDLICNHFNLERAIDRLSWPGKDSWLKTTPNVWLVNKRPVGYVREHQGLQYLLALDAGHMVPMDLPEVSLTMITNFIQNKGFRGGSTRLKAHRADIVWSDTCPAITTTTTFNNPIPSLGPIPNSTDTTLSTSPAYKATTTTLSALSPTTKEEDMTYCKGPNSTCCLQIEMQYLHPLGRSSQVTLPTPTEQFLLSLQYLFQEDIRSSILSNHPNADLIDYAVMVSNDVNNWKSPETTNMNTNGGGGESIMQVEIPIWLSLCGNPILVREIMRAVIDQLGSSDSSLRNGVLSSKLKGNSYELKEVSKTNAEKKTSMIVGRNALQLTTSSHIRTAQAHVLDENHYHHQQQQHPQQDHRSVTDVRYMSMLFILIGVVITGGYFFYTIRHAIRSFRYR